jgi:hypothetical protein
MKVTEGIELTEFEEAGFRLETFAKGKIYMYHPCKSEAVNTQILLPNEVRNRCCMHCGPVEIPGEILLLWEFLHEGREYIG